jgi:3-hydroxyisobutyrate dehydrogenase
MRDGTSIVDMGSSRPHETQKNAGVVARRRIEYVDAPVSGGVSAAIQGTLTIMVGGQEAVLARFGTLLGSLGTNVVHAGPSGAGHAVKALNNLLSASHLVASCEALVTAQRFGLDPDVVLQIINGSSGRSGSTQVKLPRYMLPRTFDSGFRLALMVKDIGIAVGLARESGVPAPHAEMTQALWANAQSKLPEDADHTEILRWLEEQVDALR